MDKRYVTPLFWIVVALFLALITCLSMWRLVEMSFPYNSSALSGFVMIKQEYDLKRWLAGLIIFAMIYISFSYNWDNRIMLLAEAGASLRNNLLSAVVIASRITLSVFLIGFWNSYVAYRWFSNISLMIGDFRNDFFIRFICITIPSLLSLYTIILEPWQKIIAAFPPGFRNTWVRAAFILFISLNFYSLGLVAFPANNIIPPLVAFLFLGAFIFLYRKLKNILSLNQTEI